MNMSSRPRRHPSLSHHRYHHLRPNSLRHPLLPVLVLLAFIVVDDMCELVRSLQFLQKRMHFASAITTNNRVLGRQTCTNSMATDRSLSMGFPSRTTRRTKYAITAETRGSLTRFFGSKRGVPGNPLGTVAIYNDQEALDDIDEDALRTTVERISKILGYETYDVTLLLVDDEEMRETNHESRGIDAPTDILSFPFHNCVENQAGLLEEPEFDIPDYYTLGDMVVCVPYVIRRCKEDLEWNKELEANDDDDDSDLVEDDDRGVSGAMAQVEDPEKRIRMLLVHGMLHLVGYDHIEDGDYVEMVQREEELLRELGEL